MVKSVIAGVTTIYISAAYQIQAGVVTKHYPGGAYRVGGTLYYGFTDHLGSSNITTDANGVKIADMRYKAWGETRYTSGDSHSDKTYTGQRSYVDDFGLMYYNARWYDNQTGRFAQADTIIPGGVQGWDRYAYTSNNPVNRIDPSGHCDRGGHWMDDSSSACSKWKNPYLGRPLTQQQLLVLALAIMGETSNGSHPDSLAKIYTWTYLNRINCRVS